MVTVLYLQRAPLFTFGVCRPRVMLGPQLVSKVEKALIEKLKGVALCLVSSGHPVSTLQSF